MNKAKSAKRIWNFRVHDHEIGRIRFSDAKSGDPLIIEISDSKRWWSFRRSKDGAYRFTGNGRKLDETHGND